MNPTDLTACEAWDRSFGDFQNPAFSQPSPPLPPFQQSCYPTPLTAEQQAQLYHPTTNPAGCRSTFQDFAVAIFGRRPPSAWTAAERVAGFGFAKSPFDNVGVQYGLRALNAGTITSEQFVNLNENIGGLDIDHAFKPSRTVADQGAVRAAYRSGLANDAARLDNVAIIDLRANNNLNDIHTAFHSYTLRERLRTTNGHAGNQIIWTFPGGIAPPGQITDEAFLLMDRWLAAVESDTSAAPPTHASPPAHSCPTTCSNAGSNHSTRGTTPSPSPLSNGPDCTPPSPTASATTANPALSECHQCRGRPTPTAPAAGHSAPHQLPPHSAQMSVGTMSAGSAPGQEVRR